MLGSRVTVTLLNFGLLKYIDRESLFWPLKFAALFLFFMFSVAFAEESLIAKRDSVKVFAKPELSSQVLAVLNSGTEVVGLQKKGLFWKVKSSEGTIGFVMITQVSSNSTILSEKLKGAMRAALKEKKTETRGSERERAQNAVMGIRGLSDGDDVAQVGSLKPNFFALETLESISVSSEDLQRLEQDVLGESEK